MDGDFVCENQDYVDFQDCDDACASFYGYGWGARRCHPSGLRVKSAMTGLSWLAVWIPAYAGMTVKVAGIDGEGCQ